MSQTLNMYLTASHEKHTLEPRLYFLGVVLLLQCFFSKAVRQKAELEATPILVLDTEFLRLYNLLSMKQLGR